MNTFLIADLHFGQETAMNWLDAQGNKMRPFKDAYEMDETIIQNWNRVVRDSVEQTQFTPISFEIVKKRMEEDVRKMC